MKYKVLAPYFHLTFIARFPVHAFLIGLFLIPSPTHAQPIRAYMDLQIHCSMHLAYGFFDEAFQYIDEEKPPKDSYKHLLKNVIRTNYMVDNPGARILCNGAIANEWVRSKKKARRVILKQIDWVNDFATANADKFVVAKTPQEVRDYVNNTDKTVIIHSIEGGNKLINSQEDANFFAEKGVAFITLIHLRDAKHGAAAILPDFGPRLINLRGMLRKEKNRGLTDLGRQAILWLANAGIMTDLTHMADGSRRDALDIMEKHGIPPISTHDGFKPIQNRPRAIPEAEILRIYKAGGFISIPISGYSIMPFKSDSLYQQQLDNLDCYCPGSIDTYKFTYLAVKDFVEGHVSEISGGEFSDFDGLTESQKEEFSIGYESDFNGWVNGSRPRYGKEGCFPIAADTVYSPVDLQGLAHPGLMPDYWKLLEAEGVDLAPIERASERFLQIWQQLLDHEGTFH